MNKFVPAVVAALLAVPAWAEGPGGDSGAQDAATLSQNFNGAIDHLLNVDHCSLDTGNDPQARQLFCTLGSSRPSATDHVGRATRNRDLQELCNAPEAQALRKQTDSGRAAVDDLVAADQAESQRAENDLMLTLGGDPFLDRAMSGILGTEESIVDSYCVNPPAQIGNGYGLQLTSARDDYMTQQCMGVGYAAVPASTHIECLTFVCSRISSGPPPREVDLCNDLYADDAGARAACHRSNEQFNAQEQANYQRQQQQNAQLCVQDEANYRRSCEQRAQQQDEQAAARRAALVQQCRDRAGAEYDRQAQARAQQAAQQAAADLHERIRSCYAQSARMRVQNFCETQPGMSADARCAGYTPERAAGASAASGASATYADNLATGERNRLLALRNAYAFSMAEPRHETCLRQSGGYASVCDALERDYNANSQRYQRIYSPDRMAKFQALGERLKDRYRTVIAGLGVSQAQKQQLLTRLGKTSFVAPNNPRMFQETRTGIAVCACHGRADGDVESSSLRGPGRSPGFTECSANTVMINPLMMLQLDSGGAVAEQEIESVLFHELGHALAPDVSATDPIFHRLTNCLDPRINTSSFASAQQLTVRKEAVADWLSSQAMAADVAAAPAGDRQQLIQRSMYGEFCGNLHHQDGSSDCMRDERDNSYLFVNEARDHGHCVDGDTFLNGIDHPLNPDRLAIYTSNHALKRALGCRSSDVQQANGCTL